MASKYPQISWLFLFLYDLSEKHFFFVFHSDFKCLEGGGDKHHFLFVSFPQIGLIQFCKCGPFLDYNFYHSKLLKDLCINDPYSVL